MRRAFLFSLLFASCAKFGAPPGGPEDKTPPEVLSCSPPSGSLQVDTGAFFEFVFSEKVVRTSLTANVFISPPLADSFRDELRGKTYRIYPNRYLRKGATYVISLGTGVRDLHGNSLAQAYSFAFSTGETIDSGEIAGQVFDKTAPVSQAFVQAFRMADTAAPPDWKKPDYQTASGKDGLFKFSFLPSGRYRLLASSGQKFGLHDRDVVTARVGEKTLPAQIFLEPLDTARLELQDARMNADRLLVLTFNRPLDFPDTLPANFKIFTGAPGEEIPVRSVFWNPNQKDKLHLVAGLPMEEKEAVVYFSDFVAKSESRSGEDSAVFLIGAKSDEIPPKPVYSEPPNRRERMGFSDTLKIYFSEPVLSKFEAGAPGLLDSLGAAVPAVWSRPQANAFFFAPQVPLHPGEWYRFRLPAGVVADKAGNPSTDSLTLGFRTYFLDSLGTVTGLLVGNPAGTVVLEFREIRSGWVKTETLLDSAFSIPLLAGKYFLSGFVDENHDRKREPGSLAPFAFPEPAFFYPDTVFVRARFETEGVDITIR
ncbi:MAG: Ig-like domain-containing protein [candidate division Zixibacteria bacterium]|nr:Ig-like domain-containing protein [candidate division Zixibacteria bacterium]